MIANPCSDRECDSPSGKVRARIEAFDFLMSWHFAMIIAGRVGRFPLPVIFQDTTRKSVLLHARRRKPKTYRSSEWTPSCQRGGVLLAGGPAASPRRHLGRMARFLVPTPGQRQKYRSLWHVFLHFPSVSINGLVYTHASHVYLSRGKIWRGRE